MSASEGLPAIANGISKQAMAANARNENLYFINLYLLRRLIPIYAFPCTRAATLSRSALRAMKPVASVWL